MWNLQKKKERKKEKDTNELVFRTETDSETLKNLRLPKGTGGRGGMDWGFGIGLCALKCMA